MKKSRPIPYLRLIFVFLSSAAISYVFYILFYIYSPMIWSSGHQLPPDEYTPWVRWCVKETDGIELFVLYPMVFAVALVSLVLNNIFNGLKRPIAKRMFLYMSGALTICYFLSINFDPPMAKVASGSGYLLFMFSVLLVVWVISSLSSRNKMITILFIIISLIPICFISIIKTRCDDLNYILSPAIRMFSGISLKNIYFQYDHLFTSLAAIWIKLSLPIFELQFIGRLSYYGLFLGIYFLANRLFNRKLFAAYLVIAMVIVRIYGQIYAPDYMLQVIPLRLDLWFIPLAFACFKGPSHWSVGLSLAFLALLHHSFGMIYVLSYIFFILILLLFDVAERKGGFKDILKRYLYLYFWNAAMILIAIFAYKIFLEAKIANISFYFQQVGIGFMRISEHSFYWYFIPILSAAFILLVLKKRELTDGYFKTGIFLLILSAGNSLYFFGRSHENNIINLSSVLLFVLFMYFDLADSELSKNPALNYNKYIMPVVSIAVIMLCAHYYSGLAIDQIGLQCKALTNGSYLRGGGLPDYNTRIVHKVAGRSGKVIFLINQLAFPITL